MMVEGGKNHHEVAKRLILGMEVSVPLLVARLAFKKLVDRSRRFPSVEDWLLCSGPETRGGGGGGHRGMFGRDRGRCSSL